MLLSKESFHLNTRIQGVSQSLALLVGRELEKLSLIWGQHKFDASLHVQKDWRAGNYANKNDIVAGRSVYHKALWRG